MFGNIKLKGIATIAFFGALAALSPAPVYHDGGHVQATASQQDLAAEQSYQQVHGVVGQVPLKLGQRLTQTGNSENEGAELVRKAQSELRTGTPSETVKDLKLVEKEVDQAKPQPFKTILWVLFAGAAGFGVFAVFKKWADKNIPSGGW